MVHIIEVLRLIRIVYVFYAATQRTRDAASCGDVQKLLFTKVGNIRSVVSIW